MKVNEQKNKIAFLGSDSSMIVDITTTLIKREKIRGAINASFYGETISISDVCRRAQIQPSTEQSHRGHIWELNMEQKRVINFGAGPAKLPQSVSVGSPALAGAKAAMSKQPEGEMLNSMQMHTACIADFFIFFLNRKKCPIVAFCNHG